MGAEFRARLGPVNTAACQAPESLKEEAFII